MTRLLPTLSVRHPLPVLLGSLLLAAFVAGCGGDSGDESLAAPETPVISGRARWAVAEQTYVQLRAEPQIDASIVGQMRGGDIAEIAERTAFRETQFGARDHWYQLQFEGLEGWVHGAQIERFERIRQAENAAERWLDE